MSRVVNGSSGANVQERIYGVPVATIPAQPSTSLPAEPSTSLPAEPSTSLPAEPSTSLPAEPSTSVPAWPWLIRSFPALLSSGVARPAGDEQAEEEEADFEGSAEDEEESFVEGSGVSSGPGSDVLDQIPEFDEDDVEGSAEEVRRLEVCIGSAEEDDLEGSASEDDHDPRFLVEDQIPEFDGSAEEDDSMEAHGGSAMSSGEQDVDAGSAEEVEEAGSAQLLYHNIFQISWSNIDDDLHTGPMWLGQCVRCKAWCCGSAGMIRHIEATLAGSASTPGCLDERDEEREIPEDMPRLVTFHLDPPEDGVEPAEPDNPSEYLVSCRTCNRAGPPGVVEAENLERHFEYSHADWKDGVGEGWTGLAEASSVDEAMREMAIMAAQRGYARNPWPTAQPLSVVAQSPSCVERVALINHYELSCSHGRHRSAAVAQRVALMGLPLMRAEPGEGRSTRRGVSEAPVAAEEVDPEEVD